MSTPRDLRDFSMKLVVFIVSGQIFFRELFAVELGYEFKVLNARKQ
jgi:hypothetical protein